MPRPRRNRESERRAMLGTLALLKLESAGLIERQPWRAADKTSASVCGVCE